jgi:hypothetical protein
MGGVKMGEWWKEGGWEFIPDHVKGKVRDKVFAYWGEYLTPDMISQASLVDLLSSCRRGRAVNARADV